MSDNEQKDKKRVSFSQYSMWSKCPACWKLNYLEGKRIYEASLNTAFGTAIHFVLQTYIQKLYTESLQSAESLELFKMFKDTFTSEIQKIKESNPKFQCNDDEITDFMFDAEDILKTFLTSSNRIKHFPTNKYEFVGTELPLEIDIKNNIQFIAFVDLVLREKETGIIKIYDFKTSSNGWNKYQQEDPAKFEQVLLYKAFYSKKFNLPLNMIDVEFFILKRKLYENVSYPQNRIQLFTPTNNVPAIATTLNSFTQFVDECFNADGNYKIDGNFPKIPGKNKKNCKYCAHKKINCDAKPDILPE